MKYYALTSLFLLLLTCCSEKPEESAQGTTPEFIMNTPTELTLRQRSIKALPGSENRVLVTLGDITGGQVMVGIAWDDRELIAAKRSMREGDQINFEVETVKYRLILKKLNNKLVGHDYADFALERADGGRPKTLSMDQEIDALMATMRELDGAVFIRNGKEHSVDEAISHLMRKRRSAGSKLQTTEQFVNSVATKSSRSGKHYLIKLSDGSETEAGKWLMDALNRLRNNQN